MDDEKNLSELDEIDLVRLQAEASLCRDEDVKEWVLKELKRRNKGRAVESIIRQYCH